MRKTYLSDLEAFASVAEHRSFRKAALERGVSTSLLSQTMRRLEEQLGVTLLRRTTRSVALTEAGEYLLSGITPAFEQLEGAIDGLNRFRSTAAGTIRINAPGPIAQFVLAPLAGRFLQQHPNMAIEICTDAAMTDIVKAGFDAGVRFNDELAQDMVAVPIGGDQRYCVVASPSYLSVRGRPAEPKELVKHVCIRQRFPSGTLFSWTFSREKESFKVVPHGALTVTDALAAVNAAKNGAGIAYVHEGYVSTDLAAGTLVKLFDDWTSAIGKPYLYYPRQRQMATALRLFIDLAKTEQNDASQ